MPNRKHFYSFIFNHIFHSCKLLGLNPNSTNIVLKASLGLLLNADPESKPPEIVYKIQDIIRRVMKNTDPYREIKDRSTRDALSIYPELKSEVSGSSHPLKTAVRIAIAGNGSF